MLKIDGEQLRLAMVQVDAAINALTDGGVRIVGTSQVLERPPHD
jgi:hypothetical protein